MERPNLWLASSGIPPDVISCFLLMMKYDGFLAKKQQSDNSVLVTLRGMLYSQFGFITCPSRLSMLAKGEIALFLMRALKAGMNHRQLYRPYGYMIHRVMKKFSSPSHHITHTMQILSNPHFQMPIFNLP